MKHLHWTRRTVRLVVLWILRPILLIVVIFATIVLVQAFAARKMPDLEPWQRKIPASEFTAADLKGGFTFAQYQVLEDRLFAEIENVHVDASGGASRLLRYNRDSQQNPADHTQNWNRSFELVPDEVRGGVLLIHGLSDSPYSMRAVAEVFLSQGYYVLAMRMPGHGTVPAGLLGCSWKDWVAAVEVGARHVQDRVGPSLSFYIGGYSNGGALAVHHAVLALEGEAGRVPDRLFLFSPAIGISAFARIARWDKLYAFIPYFEKSKWLDIMLEYDPYKYNSFPKNAGAMEWDMTSAVQDGLEKLDASGRMGEFPPVMAFQSVVDATVKVGDLVTLLFGRIETDGSELVLFDINRLGQTDDLIGANQAGWVERLGQDDTLGYRLSVITNVGESRKAKLSSKPPRSLAFADEPLDLEWPVRVFSLAHVAIPFRPDDSIYGLQPRVPGEFGLELGTLYPKGEKNVLAIPASMLVRIRCNPFFDVLERRITEAVAPQP